jgi:hypothetical protein
VWCTPNTGRMKSSVFFSEWSGTEILELFFYILSAKQYSNKYHRKIDADAMGCFK